MASYVEIANLAASKIGEDDQLRAPDDDTHLGRTIAAVWNSVRRAALRDHPWNFAVKRVALGASADTPIGWKYAYPMRPDFLRLLELLDYPTSRDWALEGGALLTNYAAPLKIRYIADVTEPSLFDAAFVDAFAARLAFQVADRITGDESRKDRAWSEYQALLKAAKRVDALETPNVRDAMGDWEIARLGYGDEAFPVSYYPGVGPQIIT